MGKDTNKKKEHKVFRKTPYQIACEKGQTGVVIELLNDKSINPNEKFITGPGRYATRRKAFYIPHKYALTIACEQGHIDTVRVLLDHPKIDISLQNSCGEGSLLHASIRGGVQMVKMILKEPTLDLEKLTEKRQNAVNFACQYGTKEIVEILLEEPRITNYNPEDLLEESGYAGNSEVFDFLLNLPNANVKNLLHRAIMGDWTTEIVEKLVNNSHLETISFVCGLFANKTALSCAIEAEESIETIKMLLSHPKLDPAFEMISKDDGPLSAAISNKNIEVVKLLLNNPAFRSQIQSSLSIVSNILTREVQNANDDTMKPLIDISCLLSESLQISPTELFSSESKASEKPSLQNFIISVTSITNALSSKSARK